MATLYIVATPIGNLKDISFRAIEVLKEVDLVLCEDTRVTKKILDHYDIKTPTLSYHQHTKISKIHHIIGMLREGKNLALVSDAGTPGISDPGNQLVGEITKETGDINIVPVPGASAVTVAASIAGFSMDKFVFMGFPPVKNKRKKFFKELLSYTYTVVVYESSHRIVKTLEELRDLNESLRVVLARELTKKFETTYRGSIIEVLEQLKEDEIKGEFVLIVKR